MGRITRRRHWATIIPMIVSLLFVPMLACSFGFPLNIKKDPAVRNVVVARRLDDRQRPIDSTRVFEPNDTFFCSVEVENLEAGSQVTAKWFYEERSLDQFTLTTDTAGSGYLGFNLSPDTGVWSLGDYRVEIELNGSKERTVNFSVQAKESTTTPSSPITITSTAQQREGTVSTPIVVEIATVPGSTPTETVLPATPRATTIRMTALPVPTATMPADSTQQKSVSSPTPSSTATAVAVQTRGRPTVSPTAAASPIATAAVLTTPGLFLAVSPVTGVTLARQLDETQKPVEPTNVFDYTDTFFCSVDVENLAANSQVTAKWYRGDEILDEFTLTTDTAGSGNLGFNLSAEEGGWPLGAYRIEIDLNGVPVRSVEFTVQPPADAIRSQVKSAILTRAVDDSNKPTDPSLVFLPTDVIHCSVRADLGKASRLTARWYDNGNLMEDYVTTFTVQENKADTYADFYLAPAAPLLPGPYSLEILLDDRLSRAMDFTVQDEIAEGLPLVASATLTPTLLEITLQPAQASPVIDVSEAMIGRISFSTAVTDDHQAINPGTQFAAGTKTIYATFDYQGFAIGSKFAQVWYLDGVETARGDSAWEREQSGHYEGSLNNEQGLLEGNYRLDILLDGNVLGSGEFTIGETVETGVTPAATVLPVAPITAIVPTVAPQGPTIGPINFSSEGLTAQQPMIPRTNFPEGTRIVYATFTYSNFQVGQVFEQLWYLDGQESGRGSFVWTDASTGQYQGSLNNENGLLPGEYRLEIKLNGQSLGAGNFIIEGAQITAVVTPVVPTQALEPTFTPVPVTTQPEAPSRVFKVVYTATEGDVHSLWTINLDGTNRAFLTDHASDPSWSPDGNSIAFYGWDGHPRGGGGVYQISVDGTNVREIWNQGSAEYLDWSPAGPKVAMNALVAGTQNKRLVIYAIDAQQWHDIGPGEQPSFSPDGANIVARTCLGSNCGLFVMGQGGENKTRVTASADDAMPSWSPLGDRIAYSSQKDGNWDIWVVNTDGTGSTRLTQDLGIDAMPVWLPDGSGIVYRSTRDGAWGIWVMNPDGSNAWKLVDAPAAADWGRDRLDVY